MRKIAILFISSLLLFTSCKNESLPRYGHHDTNPDTGEIEYHQIPEFSFVNQDEKIITQEYLDNKITIVDFFFTTCPSICPDMTKSMRKLQEDLKEYPEIQFLSHTVDPKTDTVEKLKRYAQKFKINTQNWSLVTGNKDDIYDLGVNYYMLPAQEDALAPGGFLHSEYFVIIDENRNHRGFYSGLIPREMDSLKRDLFTLMNEK